MEIETEERLRRKCSVGSTDVFCGNGIAGNVPPTVRRIFEDGAICLVYEESASGVAAMIADEFKKENYRVFTQPMSKGNEAQRPQNVKASFDAKATESGFVKSDLDCKFEGGGSGTISVSAQGLELAVPEYVRFVFAVGASLAAEGAKAVAKRLNVSWSMLITEPSSDTILCDYPPKQAFIDENIIKKCSFESIAAGWGIVLSEPLKRFEDYFALKVLSEDRTRIDEAKLKEVDYSMSNAELCVRLLEISSLKRGYDTADVMAGLLKKDAEQRGAEVRMIGEYKFLCSSLLCSFYSSFLGSPSIDVMPPASHIDVCDLAASFAPELLKGVKRIDFFDINSYFKISYILGEYRMDLLDKLGGIDLHTTQRFWRRLYPDAGYWLKSAFNAKMLLKFLAVAGELSGGLLGYASASGFVNGFLNAA